MTRATFKMVEAEIDEANDPRKLLAARFGYFGHVIFPDESEAPILGPTVRAALHQWLFEMNATKELEAVGLTARSRALLSGPPGCGKTTLAHHIAARLGLPVVVVQSQQIVSSALGGSGNNIAKLFKEARCDIEGCAIFFDEFDAIAKRRRAAEQACDAEVNNITIALLQEMDRFDGLLFAATNMAAEIDPAIWRRFQIQIEITFPGAAERFAIVKRYLLPFLAEDETISALADAFFGASPALIREGCEAIKRSLVLGPRMQIDTSLEAIMARFIVSAAPSDEMPVPTLWEDTTGMLKQLSAMPWPPERAS